MAQDKRTIAVREITSKIGREYFVFDLRGGEYNAPSSPCVAASVEALMLVGNACIEAANTLKSRKPAAPASNGSGTVKLTCGHVAPATSKFCPDCGKPAVAGKLAAVKTPAAPASTPDGIEDL